MLIVCAAIHNSISFSDWSLLCRSVQWWCYAESAG